MSDPLHNYNMTAKVLQLLTNESTIKYNLLKGRAVQFYTNCYNICSIKFEIKK
jgi:hypothetical protein